MYFGQLRWLVNLTMQTRHLLVFTKAGVQKSDENIYPKKKKK